jgi:hypothetical protein
MGVIILGSPCQPVNALDLPDPLQTGLNRPRPRLIPVAL